MSLQYQIILVHSPGYRDIKYEKSGLSHNLTGPAILSSKPLWSSKPIILFYQYGKRHRKNGPAVMLTDVDRFDYWYRGKLFLNQESFLNYVLNIPNI